MLIKSIFSTSVLEKHLRNAKWTQTEAALARILTNLILSFPSLYLFCFPLVYTRCGKMFVANIPSLNAAIPEQQK